MLLLGYVINGPQVVVALAFGFLLVWLLYALSSRQKPPYPLPPGPPGKFLVGNLGQLSQDHPEQDYIRWGKQYDSDVIHIRVLGQNIICLNSAKAANDLLDRRGANYSDRPRFTLFEIMGWGLTLTFLRYGPRFKLHRRLFQTTFTQSKVKTFRPIQIHEARKAVRSLLSTPECWKEATLLLTTSVIFRIAFGQEILDSDSPYTAMSAAANEATTNGGIAGSTLVDIFPPARYLPDWMNLSTSLAHARRSREAIQTIHDVPWEANMKDIEANMASPSFMKTHLEKYREGVKFGLAQEMTIADIKGATAAVFIAGGNSTWGTILSCMLFLTKYPELQRRVQQEIDEVVGRDRLPTFDDRPNLKHLERFMNEVMRMLPLNPLVIPHKSVKDDVYNGMFIPKGSIIFANAKAMSSNPHIYTNPEVFDPERYGRGEPFPQGNFGFGRRKCPGNILALASVYIFLATCLTTFDLEKVVGPDGRSVEPEIGLTIGLGGHPAPFECKMNLRSHERARLLMKDGS